MTPKKPADVTELLLQWGRGDQASFDALMPIVYEELRRLARHMFRGENAGHTLQTTALVNEAYLRLVGQDEREWASRKQFFCIAAQMMRRVLVDHARKKRAGKRGGDRPPLSLEVVADPADTPPVAQVDCLALHDALTVLESLDPEQARLVELKVFGGRTLDEIADTLGVSRSTVKREWRMARAWLRRALEGPQEGT